MLPLSVAEEGGFSGHVASPQVIIDNDNKQFVLFFHGKHSYFEGIQATGVAVSSDGFNFTLKKNENSSYDTYIMSYPYLKVFQRVSKLKKIEYYGLARWWENDKIGGIQIVKSNSLCGPYGSKLDIIFYVVFLIIFCDIKQIIVIFSFQIMFVTLAFGLITKTINYIYFGHK